MCYNITVQPNVYNIPEIFFTSFYQIKVSRFQAFQTGKITQSSKDFNNIINS